MILEIFMLILLMFESETVPWVLPLIISKLPPLFEGEFNPITPKAKKKVPVPEDLNLDNWIHEPEPEPKMAEENEDEDEETFREKKPLYEEEDEEVVQNVSAPCSTLNIIAN